MVQPPTATTDGSKARNWVGIVRLSYEHLPKGQMAYDWYWQSLHAVATGRRKEPPRLLWVGRAGSGNFFHAQLNSVARVRSIPTGCVAEMAKILEGTAEG